MLRHSILATLVCFVAVSGCLPGSVRTPDGREAFVVTCDKLADCMERARSRCSNARFKSLDSVQAGFTVWSGDVKRRFWAWEVVDNSGDWSDSGSLAMVVRKDEDGKPLHDDIRLAVHCNAWNES